MGEDRITQLGESFQRELPQVGNDRIKLLLRAHFISGRYNLGRLRVVSDAKGSAVGSGVQLLAGRPILPRQWMTSVDLERRAENCFPATGSTPCATVI